MESCWEEVEAGKPLSEAEALTKLMHDYTGFINQQIYALFQAMGMAAIRQHHPINKV